MKGIARSYIWWPGIDKEITKRHQISGCSKIQNNPTKALVHPRNDRQHPGRGYTLTSQDHS